MENENNIELTEGVDADAQETEGKKKICCICKREVDPEVAPLLGSNAFVASRYLCPECESDLDEATTATTAQLIGAAMDRISAKLAENDIEDKITLSTLDSIMSEASERAEQIQNGTYDFASDEEVPEEIPEELLETEEDRELDRIEEEKSKKIDKIFDWITFALLFAFVAFVAYFIIVNFF